MLGGADAEDTSEPNEHRSTLMWSPVIQRHFVSRVLVALVTLNVRSSNEQPLPIWVP